MKYFLSLLTALILGFSPLVATAETIRVERGDTLSAIAQKFNTTVSDLMELNDITNPDLIYAGTELQTERLFGAAIPTVVAVYTDSLASRISSSATSFTLTRGTDKQSRSLSGFYGFVLDEGTASEEFMTANCVATACTIVARGLDVVDGETAVTALQFEHRRGATAKITNFPQLALLSRILNGQESASSTFMIGDGNTVSSTNKYFKIDNGTATLPFLRYNETLAKWQFSDDGVSTVTFATSSASGLSASSSRSIFFTDSKVGVNASSSRGLLQDTVAGTYFGYLYLNASTTQGLKFGTGGDLQLNQAADLTLTGNVTSSGSLRVGNPITPNDAVPLTYLNAASQFFMATGTAEGAITAGRAVYVSSTGQFLQTDTTAVSSTFRYMGIAITGATAGQTFNYTRPGGMNCNQSGMKTSSEYFLNGSAGQISLTPATNFVRLGRALSATCLQLDSPRYKISGTATISSSGATSYSTAFNPRTITFQARDANTSSMGTQDNICTYYVQYSGVPYFQTSIDASAVFCMRTTANSQSRTGALTQKADYGFTLNTTDGSSPQTVTLYWTATN
jgi:hypothetical protein